MSGTEIERQSDEETKWHKACQKQNTDFAKAMLAAGYGDSADVPITVNWHPKLIETVVCCEDKTTFRAKPPASPTLRSIAQEVSAKYGVSLKKMRGPSPARHVAWPRQEVFWRARRELPEALRSYTNIGRFFGRDRATVRFGEYRHEERRRKDDRLD